MNDLQREALHRLPSVEETLNQPVLEPLRSRFRRDFLTEAVRETIDRTRGQILADPVHPAGLDAAEAARQTADRLERRVLSLRRVINATGTITHTNLGRAALPKKAVQALRIAAANNVNLEYDLEKGGRGDRMDLIEDALKRLTGAEAAAVVNNNAAAVLIALKALAEGRETVVSRGELIEIGGSFRLPEVMEAAGTRLREVGTTNRTHPRDYERAIGEETALLLKAHPSNFRIRGFTRETSVEELAEIGKRRGVPVMEDLGSGALINLERYELPPEPTVRERIAAGADIVSFSGDKLLGGPQCGILAGSAQAIQTIRTHPMMRALRVCKLTLSALAAALDIYETSAHPERELPTLRQMTEPLRRVRRRAKRFAERCAAELGGSAEAYAAAAEAQIGSGAQPERLLKSFAVVLRPLPGAGSAAEWEALLRGGDPPAIARVREGALWLDFRSVRRREETELFQAVLRLKND